jgi:hypothetical protein
METRASLSSRRRAGALDLSGRCALPLLLVLLAAGCEYEEQHPLRPDDDSLLKLEAPYPGQRVSWNKPAAYRFWAEQRGAYLIVVSGNTESVPLTIGHPMRTCFIQGNGSCELVSSPFQVYDVQIATEWGHEATFTLRVTHSEGKGRFQGEVGRPVGLELNAPADGTVGVRESSYYTFTTGTGGPHTIRLAGTESDLLWLLFDREVFDVILQECDAEPAARDEVCHTPPLRRNTRYFLKVEERSGVPGRYALKVEGA